MLYIQKLSKSEVPETHGTHSLETHGIHLVPIHETHSLETRGIHLVLTCGAHPLRHMALIIGHLVVSFTHFHVTCVSLLSMTRFFEPILLRDMSILYIQKLSKFEVPEALTFICRGTWNSFSEETWHLSIEDTCHSFLLTWVP
jgi:hypothetical protein